MKALITGVLGQDGSYLAEYLVDLDFDVHGSHRYSSHTNYKNIQDIKNLKLHVSDVSDPESTYDLIKKVRPDWIFNLAALSHVAHSFTNPYAYMSCVGLGIVNIMEAVRKLDLDCKIYQAGSSEQFGSMVTKTIGTNNTDKEGFQNENTPMVPNSPYGIAKLAAFNYVRQYREAYGLNARTGILFNHESPRRGDDFLTKKVANFVSQMRDGKHGLLKLGNLTPARDWSHAKDMVRGMTLMMTVEPKDYVLCSGHTHTVKDFVEKAFNLIGKDANDYIVNDPDLHRPYEVPFLRGDSSLAREELGWIPTYSFEDLVHEMVFGEKQ